MLAKGLLLRGRDAVVMTVLLSLLSCGHEAAVPAASEAEEEQTPWTGVDLGGKALYSESQEELIIRDFFRIVAKASFST